MQWPEFSFSHITRYLTLLAIFGAGLQTEVQAQVYRPLQRWSELKTPHFRIIYKAGEDSVARVSARILETQYEGTAHLTGGRVRNHPVILNSYNDRSNGYVSPLLFRTEVELPPIKGKSMNPRTGGWLETVLPHELTHAQNMQVMPAPGFSWFLSLFSPDYGRSMNSIAHAGFLEGAAVYYESGMGEFGGRGHWSPFVQSFLSNWNSEGNTRRWGIGQSLGPASVTWPSGRHYIGGYSFIQYLHEQHSPSKTSEIIDFHSKWPFLGLGIAIFKQTGMSHASLRKNYSEWVNRKNTETREQLSSSVQILNIPHRGILANRPVWISEDEILFKAKSYNTPEGLYQVNIKNNKSKIFNKTSTVEDNVYSLYGNNLILSRYDIHPFHENRYTSRLYSLDIRTKRTYSITNSERIFAPNSTESGVIDALSYDETVSSWVRKEYENDWETILALKPDHIVQIARKPGSDQYAVIINRNGDQGIWLVEKGKEQSLFTKAPALLVESGSVTDIAWHPTENVLLISIDYNKNMGIYEFNIDNNELIYLNIGSHIAMEASYSPDGRKIALVVQDGNEMKLAIADTDALTRQIAAHIPLKNAVSQKEQAGNMVHETETSWTEHKYRGNLNWLKPRVFIPTAESGSGAIDPGFGIHISSSEILRRHSYSADFMFRNEGIWHDVQYTNTYLYPGFVVNWARQPMNGSLTYQHEDGTTSQEQVIFDDNRISVKLPFSWNLKQNVRTSGMRFTPEIQFRRFGLYNHEASSLVPDRNITTFRGFAMFYKNIERTLRDVQYRSGQILFADYYTDLHSYTNTARNSLRLGLDTYWPVFARYNHSLHVRTQILTQDGGYRISPSNLHRDYFSDIPYVHDQNHFNLQFRYSFPLIYPDNGGLLVPVFLDKSYLTLFSNTVAPFGSERGFDLLNQSRSTFGGAIHFVTGFPNFRIDIGFGVAYEPMRRKHVFFIE